MRTNNQLTYSRLQRKNVCLFSTEGMLISASAVPHCGELIRAAQRDRQTLTATVGRRDRQTITDTAVQNRPVRPIEVNCHLLVRTAQWDR